MADDVLVVVYDKLDQYKGQLIPGLTADIVVNGPSALSFTVDDDHDLLPKLTADGARFGVVFRGKERFRGPRVSNPIEGPTGTVQIDAQSDLARLWQIEGWPVSGAALNAQTVEYRHLVGPSETVFRTAVAENLARLASAWPGRPWTAAASSGRGQATVADLRFHPLGDKVIDPLTRDNLIIALTYSTSGNVTVGVRSAATVKGTFTPESGVPASYKISRTEATATRAIVGGRGDGVEREFVLVIDAAREARMGVILETFVDARNTDEGADISVEGVAALVEMGEKVGIAFTLDETPRFRYGSTYQEGDLLHVQVGPLDVLAPITKVSISQSASGGVEVIPTVGDVDADDEDVLIRRQVADLAKGMRDNGRR